MLCVKLGEDHPSSQQRHSLVDGLLLLTSWHSQSKHFVPVWTVWQDWLTAEYAFQESSEQYRVQLHWVRERFWTSCDSSVQFPCQEQFSGMVRCWYSGMFWQDRRPSPKPCVFVELMTLLQWRFLGSPLQLHSALHCHWLSTQTAHELFSVTSALPLRTTFFSPVSPKIA